VRSQTRWRHTLRSIGDIARYQRLLDNDQQQLAAKAMLQELLADNRALAGSLRATHSLCERHFDVATISLLESRIDETE
jgi:starvation-inducible DNA-binding protein